MAKKTTEKKLPPEIVSEIGKRLRDACKASGVSQMDIVRAADVYQPSVSRFMNGDRGLDADQLLAVLRAAAEAGINIEFVLLGVGDPMRRGPLVVAPDPEARRALIAYAAQLAQQEAEDDSSPSEPKIPSDKRRKPSPASR